MPHTRLMYRLLVLLAFGSACGSSETPAEEEETVAVDESAESSAETAPAERPARPSAAAPDPAQMAEGMAQFRAAIDAAANAEGDTPCERSYNGILAMMAALPEMSPEESGVPTPEVFMEGCNELPEAAQSCLNPGYGVEHPECRAMLQTPEVQAFVRSVGGPGAPRPGAPRPGAGALPPGLPQPSPGATPCERAYNGMQAMFESRPEARGAQMPERGRFMAACAELPEETALCADPGYGAGHPECMEWLGTPEAMAFRNALQPTN